jgi:hydrophobic/amphiphilic exporter-1 (mainly G- bacteria), HAE1 family
MALARTSVSRPIATAMAYMIVITLGLISFRHLPVDLLPPIEFPQLNIQVSYGNVGPEEMELIVTERIENAIAGVPNLLSVNSSVSEGSTQIQLRFSQGVNLDEAANDVRAALDRVRRDLPAEMDTPRINRFDPNQQAIVVVGALSDRPLAELTRVLERDIIKAFEQIEGVGAIDIWGGVYREINVELMRDRLNSTNVTATDVVNAINRENTNLPGGNVREGMRDLYVRTLGEFTDVEQIANTVVTVIDGNPVRVRDVAHVDFGYADINRYVEIDGRPTIRMGLRKQTGGNTVEVARRVRAEVERINAIRGDLQLRVITDQSEFIQSSIDNVRNSAIWGGVLAIIVLLAFLRNGSATMVVAVAIPISIIATFALLYFGGLTLNQMSFGGLALGVGLIVDNAIVVLENIVRQRQRGKDRTAAALIGTSQVTGAIIAATLTTTVIFLPVVFMQTTTGTMFQELAMVVVFALFCSLLVALTLVPMLASKFLTVKPDLPDPASRSRAQRMFDALDVGYGRVVATALNWRGTVAMVTVALVVFSAMMFPRIPFELAPQMDGDELQVRMRMDEGTNIAIMYQYLQSLEDAVRAAVPPNTVLSMTNDVRNNQAQIDIVLTEPGVRSMTAGEIGDTIRRLTQNAVPGAEIQVSARGGLWMLQRLFRGGGGGGGGESLELQLRGHEIAIAEDVAQEVIARMETVPGVADADASTRDRRPEQNVRFDRERMAHLGLGIQDIATALQTNVGGRRAGVFRLSGEEIPINVRLRPADRIGVMDLDSIGVRANDGSILPVSVVTTQESARGPSSISRIDGQRVTYITANLETGVALGDAVQAIQRELSQMALPDGFSVYFGGEYEEQQQAQRDFRLAILIAVALIYMVMAAQFERFLDPLIVMFSVPLVIIGVVPTMLLTGTTVNLQSMMGVVMLLGIVVNNAIVLVDYINLMRREEGLAVREAVIEAAKLRLRPILMTTLTTILGLLPLSFGIGTGAELQAALARVVIGGLAASTLITLVLIPVVYLTAANIVERVHVFRGELRTRLATR